MRMGNTRRCARSRQGHRNTPLVSGAVGSRRSSHDHTFWLTFYAHRIILSGQDPLRDEKRHLPYSAEVNFSPAPGNAPSPGSRYG
jgi:hypothetical protein